MFLNGSRVLLLPHGRTLHILHQQLLQRLQNRVPRPRNPTHQNGTCHPSRTLRRPNHTLGSRWKTSRANYDRVDSYTALLLGTSCSRGMAIMYGFHAGGSRDDTYASYACWTVRCSSSTNLRVGGDESGLECATLDGRTTSVFGC